MSDRAGWSRRQVIGTAASASLAAPLAAQHEAHAAAAKPATPAKHQRFLAEHEFATLRALCDLILPADEASPSASAAGAPEYIDLLCRGNERLAALFHGGLAWLDSTCLSLRGVSFRQAGADEQTALLEKLAYREKTPAGWQAGAIFFDWARRMTVDAFYTSPAGYKDVGYQGGRGMTVFQVPEEVLRQALERLKW